MTQGVPQGVCVCSTYPAYKGTPKIQKKDKTEIKKDLYVAIFWGNNFVSEKSLNKKGAKRNRTQTQELHGFLLAVSVKNANDSLLCTVQFINFLQTISSNNSFFKCEYLKLFTVYKIFSEINVMFLVFLQKANHLLLRMQLKAQEIAK